MRATEGEQHSAWPQAIRLITRWLEQGERVDALLESLPAGVEGAERARCQHLVFGTVRHGERVRRHLGELVAHSPRLVVRAVLLAAGFELIEAGDAAADGQAAKIVHHAVEWAKRLASPAEARLVNAVARKLAQRLAEEQAPGPEADAAALAGYYSHPEWLVARWLGFWPKADVRRLLAWNQQPGRVMARWRPGGGEAVERPAFLRATEWADFYEVAPGHWPEVETLLREGRIYLQDPATGGAVRLLDARPGEWVLDLCAAPGGKSVWLADLLTRGAAPAGGGVVAVDLPGARLDRLRENLQRVRGVRVALAAADLRFDLGRTLRARKLPEAYPAVLLDAPCSNTGVMRHRVDVKWRLAPDDFAKHSRQQLRLLTAAARQVAPGGRLVYSTCSIDPEENEEAVKRFLAVKQAAEFTLEETWRSVPWQTPHDGAAAFRLRRK